VRILVPPPLEPSHAAPIAASPSPLGGENGPWEQLGNAMMTHYWDCCKPSCGWNDPPIYANNNGRSVETCGAADGEAVRLDVPWEASVCDGGPAFTCTDQLPWVEGGTLYGYVANQDTGDKSDCGTCYELELSGAANGVTRAVVQLTNKGGMGRDGSKQAVFDLLVPGGGFGDYTGCSGVPGWAVYTDQGGPCSHTGDTAECWRYGGFGRASHCESAFPGDVPSQEACRDVLFGLFPPGWQSSGPVMRGNVDVVRRRVVDCPAALTASTGVSGVGRSTTNDWPI